FAQLGVRGVCAILFGSGDNGGGRGTIMTGSDSAHWFIHNFPASCYVFSLRFGRSLSQRQTSGPGVAVSLSSGGFSNYFARPSYWDQAVSTFLFSRTSAADIKAFTRARGIPDIAAQAINF
ncbi:hypothetical protein EDB89DRAFT_1814476, partial [Lactarius sanguifluus]